MSSICSSINLSAGEGSTRSSLLVRTAALNVLVWYQTKPNKTLQRMCEVLYPDFPVSLTGFTHPEGQQGVPAQPT